MPRIIFTPLAGGAPRELASACSSICPTPHSPSTVTPPFQFLKAPHSLPTLGFELLCPLPGTVFSQIYLKICITVQTSLLREALTNQAVRPALSVLGFTTKSHMYLFYWLTHFLPKYVVRSLRAGTYLFLFTTVTSVSKPVPGLQ